MDLTSLDSQRWQELRYCWSDGRLVESLKVLTRDSDRSEEAVKRLEKMFDTINDSIFHQQSTYPATYITVPILIDACDSLPYSLQSWIVDMVSSITLQGDPHGELTETELTTWFESLKIATKLCEQLFREDRGKDSDAKLSLLGALAIFKGWDESGTRIRHANEEDFRMCSACDEKLINQGLMVNYNPQLPFENYLNFNRNESPCYLTPIKRVLNLDGEQTPVVPRSIFPDDSEVAWLIKLAKETSNQKIVRWLENFFGNGDCPNCGGAIEMLN